MVCFLTVAPFAVIIPTWTPLANIWRYGMGLETPVRTDARLSQEQNSVHFFQEVVLARGMLALTMSHCTLHAVCKSSSTSCRVPPGRFTSSATVGSDN